MKSITDDNDNGPLFDLSLENELLILKLKAEFGTECSEGSGDLPPEVVNEFLRSVYDFEHKFREPRPIVTVYEKIGRPPLLRSDAIEDGDIPAELNRVKALLNHYHLELDVLGEYSDRHIYRFITEEFVHHQMEEFEMKGYMHHFCYEDFYPNYELEIRQRSVEFLLQWFSQKLGEYSWELADPFIHPDSRQFSRETVLRHINNFHESFTRFSNCHYEIHKLEYEWDDTKQTGSGFVYGYVKYDATTEIGEQVHYEGAFEFYLCNSGTWWTIFYFVFPGFVWK